jgi:hypothetical protein
VDVKNAHENKLWTLTIGTLVKNAAPIGGGEAD